MNKIVNKFLACSVAFLLPAFGVAGCAREVSVPEGFHDELVPGRYESEDGKYWLELDPDGTVPSFVIMGKEGAGLSCEQAIEQTLSYQGEWFVSSAKYLYVSVPNGENRYEIQLRPEYGGDWSTLIYYPCDPDFGSIQLQFQQEND